DVSADDVAASFQAAVVDVLVHKSRRAAESVGATAMVLGGGVAANSLLRERFAAAAAEDGGRVLVPSRAMCTDNAAMIAAAGWYRLRSDGPTPLDVGASPGLRLPLASEGRVSGCTGCRRTSSPLPDSNTSRLASCRASTCGWSTSASAVS